MGKEVTNQTHAEGWYEAERGETVSTIEDIAKGIAKLIDEVAKMESEHKQRVTPVKDKLDVLQRAMEMHMKNQGVQRLTVPGVKTFFFKTTRHVSVDDLAAWSQWLIENGQTEFLVKKCRKEAALEWLDEHGELPPGLSVNAITKMHVIAN